MKIALKNETLVLLRNCLQVPGSAKTFDLMFKHGRLLVEILPQIKDRPDPEKDQAGWKLWAKEPVPEFEISDGDAELCRTAFKYGVEKEAFGASEWSFDLQNALKLVPS